MAFKLDLHTPKPKLGGEIPTGTPASVRDLYNMKLEEVGGDPQLAIQGVKESIENSHAQRLMDNKKRDDLFTEQQESGGTASEFVTSTLTKNLGKSAPNHNVEYKSKAVEGILMADFVDAADALRTTHLGAKRDKVLADELIRALYDPAADVSPHAKQYAKNWSDMAERARTWFNRVGGDIKKLGGWNLPQSHNMSKIRKVGKDQWVRFIEPLLDAQAMEVAPGDLTRVLGEVYDTLSTGGLNKLMVDSTKQTPNQGKKLGNKHQDSRFLRFADADSHILYQQKFGDKDPYVTMTNHIRGMSDDIALVEIFGTNPEATFKDLQLVAKQQGASANTQEAQQRIFDVVSGRVDQDASVSAGDEKFAAASGGYRSLKTSSVLGSAMVSALSDPVFTILTAGYNGIPIGKVVGNGIITAFREMIPGLGTGERVKMAARLGVVSDAFTGSLANTRYAEGASGKANALASGVLRASGLTAWTNAWRSSFSLEFLGMLGDNVGRTVDTAEGFGKVLNRFGISPEEWASINRNHVTGEGKFLDPTEIAKTNPELATKILRMVNEELDYAVIMPDARIRSITTWGQPKGTVGGEAARSAFMFKSFPLSAMALHVGRTLGGDMTKMGKIGYGSAMIVGTTSIGMGVIQLREMLKGKEAREVSPKLAVQGFVQGGGLGIAGDLMFQDTTKYGASLASVLSSPVFGDANLFWKATKGNWDRKQAGKDTHTGSDAVRMLQGLVPGQNLWYTRLLMDRYIFDNVKKAVDPKYHKKIRKQTKDMRKDYNQGWMWKPGT